ncbi:MAG: methyltransferase [Metallosphaera yellowstonensis]|jgi:release factor glutamine methyltransferase|uniref:HemK-related putative methylase n=1 Tax=Metallosphaera yellowstonensis MK1 TaxID=671065 RepID=H2C6M8_9CREN|nr:HemK2/MTQ2 family protein methyltransferase [Metallosphaera yellowstonensis]EHP69455.1 HemK-related putative methylase [Metallosphaera yellowstonensis MK1]
MSDQVYEPAEDSELLASILRVVPGERVIDVGSGTGILGILAAKMGGQTISVDINPFASVATLCSSNLNNVHVNVINCDLLSCIRKVRFDVAIFNPPYLPVDEKQEWIGYSWSGGAGGVVEMERFLSQIEAKRIYLVYSSFTDEDALLTTIKSRRLEVTNSRELVKGYEVLKAVELVDKSSSRGT